MGDTQSAAAEGKASPEHHSGLLCAALEAARLRKIQPSSLFGVSLCLYDIQALSPYICIYIYNTYFACSLFNRVYSHCVAKKGSPAWKPTAAHTPGRCWDRWLRRMLCLKVREYVPLNTWCLDPLGGLVLGGSWDLVSRVRSTLIGVISNCNCSYLTCNPNY